MVMMFWVRCPKCEDDFYAHAELRGTDYELLCPYCSNRFKEQESPKVWGDTGSSAGWS